MDVSGIFTAIFLMWIVGFAAVIWGLVDVVRVADDSMFRAGDRLIWVLVILFANLVGVIVYVIVGRPAPGSQPRPPGPPSGSAPDLPPPPPPARF
jgi:hypothetical protein